MAEKKTFLLRIAPEMWAELDAWAQEEFRSINGQIEFILNQALRKRKRESVGETQPIPEADPKRGDS